MPDRYFVIRYSVNSKMFEEKLGWASQGWTLEKAIVELSKLKQNQTMANGPQTLREKRSIEDARKEAVEQLKIKQEREGITFSKYFNDIYFPIAKRNKKPMTYKTESSHFTLWLAPVIGNKPLKDIRPFHFEQVKKRMLDAGKSPRTVQYALATARQVWNMARNDDLISGDSPTRKVRAPKFDNKRERFFTKEEEKDLLEALRYRNPVVYQITLLSLRTGMRASEIFKLKWNHIDTVNSRILIMDAKGNKNRIAIMTDEVKSMFKNADRLTKDPAEHVFKLRGERINEVPDIFTIVVKELKFNEGINDRRQQACFHTCRHTFASRLVASGVDLYTVKTLLGHSSITLTERYSHLSHGALHDAMKTFEKPEDKIESNVVSIASKIK